MKRRLFLAIPLPEELKSRISSALEQYRSLLTPAQLASFRFIPPENWHITIYFFGDVEAEKVTLLQSLLEPLLHQTSVFRLDPDRLLMAPPEKKGKNMIWMRYHDHPSLTRLSWQIYELTRSAFHFSPPRQVLVPHVTVVRFKNLSADYHLPPMVQPDHINELAVEGCELWDSILGESGAVYSGVATYGWGGIHGR
jgi:2'-5' RNA ligase